jgi:hypothetical protein
MSEVRQGYEVRFIPDGVNPHPTADNVDVEVVFDSGEFYVATFFTLENIRGLMEKNRRTGECLGGLYLWASDMIIVERLTLDAVSRTVADLLVSGEFGAAFSGPHRPDVADGA